MCLYFQFDSICVFSELFEPVGLLSKQSHAFRAYILLPHVFSLHVTLTQLRVTHFTHSRHISFYEEIWLLIPKLSLLSFLIWSTGTPSIFSSMLTIGNYFYDFLFTSPIEEIFTKWGLHLRGRIYLKKCKLFPFSVTPCE